MVLRNRPNNRPIRNEYKLLNLSICIYLFSVATSLHVRRVVRFDTHCLCTEDEFRNLNLLSWCSSNVS